MIDTRLKVFRSVATLLSFTKAANELFISQPAISKHIQELEKEYGVQLFDRIGNRIQLTCAGQLMLDHACKIIDAYQNLDFDMKKLTEKSGGELRIGAIMSFALATGTRFLLMDEPTNGLDIPSKSQFRKVIANNMTEDRTLIISTHQVHDVESLLDHIIIMNQSQLLLDASVSDICGKYTFEYRNPQEIGRAHV